MYQAKDFSNLIGTPGFSEPLLRNHFTLYEGYVKNANALTEQIAAAEPGSPAKNELRRRFGWEWNGMRLHELYFGNMKNGASPLSNDALLGRLIADQFGSVDAWRKDFASAGAARGIGWVVLALDKEEGRLLNLWVNEHDVGHLVGAKPILVLDVFEHAYMLDYGLKRPEYIEAFFGTIDWDSAQERLSGCMCG